MSRAKNAFQSIINLSSTVLVLFASLFAFFLTKIRGIFTKNAPVHLTHGAASAVVDEGTGMTLVELIKAKCPSLYGPEAVYKPTWWLPGGNLQTVWCVIGEMIHRDAIPYERQLLRVADGGTISLDVFPPFEGPEDDTPILFILHGLTGTTQESYIRSTVKEVTRTKVAGGPGFRVVAMNFRGCDVDTPVTSQRLYHAAETDDTRAALLWLTQNYPKSALYGAAYSMGASTMATYLGEEGETTPLKGAVCISNPWNWTTATEFIEEGSFLNKYVYGPVLADALLTMFKNSQYAFEADPRLDIPDIHAKRYVKIRYFDDKVTSKLFGFADADDYYVKASSSRFLHGIKVPHLSIQSTDDPMVAAWNLPVNEVVQSEHVVMAHTNAGGHVAWFTTEDGELKRWFSKPIREFIEALHSVDPTPKPAPRVTAPDAKGMIYQVDMSDRVGFLPITGEGLMTAKKYHASAQAPALGS